MLWYHVYVYYNQIKLHELLLIGCSENRLWTMCSINILLQNRSALFNLQLTCSARFWWIRCRVWRFAFMHAYPSNMVLKIITKVVIFLSFRSFFKISNGSFCLPAPLPPGGGGEGGGSHKVQRFHKCHPIWEGLPLYTIQFFIFPPPYFIWKGKLFNG